MIRLNIADPQVLAGQRADGQHLVVDHGHLLRAQNDSLQFELCEFLGHKPHEGRVGIVGHECRCGNDPGERRRFGNFEFEGIPRQFGALNSPRLCSEDPV